ncbi:MAG TPA: PIN domain-containing protein [Terriglobales bacterium]|nr:PIN domain-containing protein [Terriglobales bacterium]
MIFVDTSAIYAWADSADPNHSSALRRLDTILEAGEELLTHNYVLVESMALLQARLGLSTAIKLAKDARTFALEWVDEELHARAVQELERSKKRQVSLVDHISFLVMRKRHVSIAFAFDSDFTAAGFRLFSE